MIKNFFNTELAKMKEMNFTEKRQYIWEYYRAHIIGFGIVAFIVGSLINVWFINPPKDEYLHFAWLYPNLPQAQFTALEQDLSAIVPDPDRQLVAVFSYALTDNPEANMALQTRFFALIQSGSVDALLVQESELVGVAEQMFLQPVTGLMEYVAARNPELYTKLSQRTTTITYQVDDEPPVTDIMAISLEGAPLFEYHNFPTQGLQIGMMLNANRFYEMAKALEFIFDMAVVYDV